MIDNGAFTELLLETLSVHGDLLGDGVAPTEGGWLTGQPNANVFRPYSVLVSGGMQPVQSPNLIKTDRPDYNASWSLRHFGGSRKQCDWIAQQFRDQIYTLRGLTFGADTYKINSVSPLSIGAVSRNDQVDPPYWQAFDNLTILVTPFQVRQTSP